MPYQTWLADAAREAGRAAGVTVTEWSGWRTRGSSTFNPKGTVDHHDASSTASGNNGALYICIHGRSGLPGPLCNFFIKRNGDIVVVAAGRANHAGSGSWQGVSGNSNMIGIEAANNGVGEAWSPKMISAYVELNRAIIRRKHPLSMLCAHKEWTTRKIDPYGGPFTTTRSISNYRSQVGSPVKPKEDVMNSAQEAKLDKALERLDRIERVIAIDDRRPDGPVVLRHTNSNLSHYLRLVIQREISSRIVSALSPHLSELAEQEPAEWTDEQVEQFAAALTEGMDQRIADKTLEQLHERLSQ